MLLVRLLVGYFKAVDDDTASFQHHSQSQSCINPVTTVLPG
jgi:hypothetical protein